MIVTREDLGNTSTPSSATTFVGGAASATPSATLGGVRERVADYSVDNMGVVCGVCGAVW